MHSNLNTVPRKCLRIYKYFLGTDVWLGGGNHGKWIVDNILGTLELILCTEEQNSVQVNKISN